MNELLDWIANQGFSIAVAAYSIVPDPEEGRTRGTAHGIVRQLRGEVYYDTLKFY